MSLTEIGARIRAERKEIRMTLKEMSELCDISSNFLWEIENGKKVMSINTLIKISNTLHKTTDYILYGKAQPSEVPSVEKDRFSEKEIETQFNFAVSKLTTKEKQLFIEMFRLLMPHIKSNALK